MNNPFGYSITIERFEEGGESLFLARVRELPDVAEYAETIEDAYSLACDTIETTAEIFSAQGRKMPSPFGEHLDVSGRMTLRLPRWLHGAMSEGAEVEGVSLNQHVVSLLSYCAGAAVSAISHTQTWTKFTPVPQQRKTPNLQVVKSQPVSVPANEGSWKTTQHKLQAVQW